MHHDHVLYVQVALFVPFFCASLTAVLQRKTRSSVAIGRGIGRGIGRAVRQASRIMQAGRLVHAF